MVSSEISPPAGIAAPVGSSERIVAIDVLRGFSVLGILLMNVQSFSMISAAYLNPVANDKLAGTGFWVWSVSHLLADLKFMAIFSMLFGAGIVLMSERAEERKALVGKLHRRRQGWLLLIGLAHAHLLWYGDILVPYAICGLLLFRFRKAAAHRLLVFGTASIVVAGTFLALTGSAIDQWPPEVLEEQAASWAPPAQVAQAEIEAYTGGWLAQTATRSAQARELELFVFVVYLGWRIAGLMLIGMGLFKLGVLSAQRSEEFYRRLAFFGLGIGLPIVALGIDYNVNAGFVFEKSMFHGALFNYVGSLGVGLGYVGVVMLAAKRGWLGGLQRRLAAVGRMALTNYLTQTLICTFLFYGHGLGLFEQVRRPAQLAIVAAVWAIQMLWSPWWLRRYRYGPFEWVWRSLTYGSAQPFKRAH